MFPFSKLSTQSIFEGCLLKADRVTVSIKVEKLLLSERIVLFHVLPVCSTSGFRLHDYFKVIAILKVGAEK